MKMLAISLRAYMISLAVLFAAILATPAHAIGINPEGITFTANTSDIVLTEGSTGTATFTVAFPGDDIVASIDLGVVTIVPGTVTAGSDPTDAPLSLSFSAADDAPCGTTLAAGSTCTQTLTVLTPSGVGETDADSWTGQFTFEQDYSTLTGGSVVPYYAATAPFSITVNDVPLATPEPSSLLLLGTGLLGTLALAARSKRHAQLTTC
jgi:hypothetical protein